MSFRLLVRCDHGGCPTEAVIENEEAGPAIATPFNDRVGGMFLLDSSWIDLPGGWDMTSDGRELCPAHAGPRSE